MIKLIYIEAEIGGDFTQEPTRVQLSPEDLKDFIALAETLKPLLPEKRATGSSGSVLLGAYLRDAIPTEDESMMTATGARLAAGRKAEVEI